MLFTAKDTAEGDKTIVVVIMTLAFAVLPNESVTRIVAVPFAAGVPSGRPPSLDASVCDPLYPS